MRRREFIAGLGGAAIWPVTGQAQPRQSVRIGVMTIQQRTSPPYAAFDQRLRELGYVDGQNLSVEFVNPNVQAGGIAGGIEELVRRKCDVIVTPYAPAVESALAASNTVPIVMIAIDY